MRQKRANVSSGKSRISRRGEDQIAAANDDGTLRIWDARRGEPLQVRQGHTDIVLALCYSPDGKRLASGSADGTTRIWSTADSTEPLVLKGSGEWIKALAFSPDSRRLAVGSGDLFIRIWTMEVDGAISERVLAIRERELGPEHLDGHLALVLEVLRQVHGGHAALPQAPYQPIRTKLAYRTRRVKVHRAD